MKSWGQGQAVKGKDQERTKESLLNCAVKDEQDRAGGVAQVVECA
jgi:hypothetical protein